MTKEKFHPQVMVRLQAVTGRAACMERDGST